MAAILRSVPGLLAAGAGPRPSGGTTAAPALDPQLPSGFEYLFTRGADHHIWWDEGLVGGTFYDLGRYATSAPAAMTATGGCALALFIRGGNGGVYRTGKSAPGTAWSSWQSAAASTTRSTPGTSTAAAGTAGPTWADR